MSSISQQVLSVLGQRIGAFHVREIRDAAQLSKDQLQGALRTLLARGYAERVRIGRIKATSVGLAFLEAGKEVKLGPTGPRTSETEGTSLRCRLWKAVRLARKATISELLELAARGTEANATQNAKEYLNALVRSGHLMRLSRRAQAEWPVTTGESRYCLVRDTGPQVPKYDRRQKHIFDPNTGETFDLA